MTTTLRIAVRTASLGTSLALLLAACSGGSSGLTTGSLLPGSKPAVTDETTDRALMVATTSARAVKCGYNFDPARLRTAYLAHEASLGAAPEVLVKAERSYDYTRDAVIKRIAQTEDFCDEVKTADIKRDLTRHLAGDFALPPKKAAPPGNWWGGSGGSQDFDREKVFDPLKRK
ncbi:MAG: hypothetical protein ACKVP7_02150 [Hyphomicrobiaceae bacterium]